MGKLTSHCTVRRLCLSSHSLWCLLAWDSPYLPEPLFVALILIPTSTSVVSVVLKWANGLFHSPKRHPSGSCDSEDHVTYHLVSEQLPRYSPQYPCAIGQLACCTSKSLYLEIAHTPDLQHWGGHVAFLILRSLSLKVLPKCGYGVPTFLSIVCRSVHHVISGCFVRLWNPKLQCMTSSFC